MTDYTQTPRSGAFVPTSANDGTELAEGLLQMGTDLDNLNLVRSYGKSIIATSESRTNTAFGTLTTPDQVEQVVLPTDGLIVVSFHATWENSVAGAGRAAIFLGTNQIKIPYGGGAAPIIQQAIGNSNAATAGPLGSFHGGLHSVDEAVAYTGPVTTGQIIGTLAGDGTSYFGGSCEIEAAAGTYTIGVRFAATSGSVTVSNRKLWVRSLF